MAWKCHNHRSQTNPGHKEEETQNTDFHMTARKLFLTPGRRQSKMSILSTNKDQKSLETEFSIAICHLIGDKWQSKTLFLAIFDPHSLIVKSMFDCHLPSVFLVNW